MEPSLRRAWTEVISADDYETHMAAIGQAQAAASLTEWLLTEALLEPDSRITIVGAGTGQMFDFADAGLFLPHRLTCADLNSEFLEYAAERLAKYRLRGQIIQDDLENTRLAPGPDLLVATLVLEHINWRIGVQSICEVEPRRCGIIMQVNPPDMQSAVTPGLVMPPSIRTAAERCHPVLLSAEGLISSFEACGYSAAGNAHWMSRIERNSGRYYLFGNSL